MAIQRAVARVRKVPCRKESGGLGSCLEKKGCLVFKNCAALQRDFGADLGPTGVVSWTARFAPLSGTT